MIDIRRAAERGHGQHGWLDTFHTFSFGSYFDPSHNNFRALRVMNEDRIAPGQGFGMHAHRDMEIVTYVLEGALQHKDNLGNDSILRPSQFQRISAGTGIRHSESNPSATEPVHLYQIWLTPRETGLEPGYEQKAFEESERQDRFRLVASPEGADGSLLIQQQACIFLSTLSAGSSLEFELSPRHYAWLQVLRGRIVLNNIPLESSDGAAISNEQLLSLHSLEPSEVMLFDLI